MRKINAYQTHDGEIFAYERAALEHETMLMNTIKEIAPKISEICSAHNCCYCPFSIKTPTSNLCPFQDVDESFCSPDDWTLKFNAE